MAATMMIAQTANIQPEVPKSDTRRKKRTVPVDQERVARIASASISNANLVAMIATSVANVNVTNGNGAVQAEGLRQRPSKARAS
jgi:hypothetical protein